MDNKFNKQEIIEYVKQNGYAEAAELQMKFGISYKDARSVITDMQIDGELEFEDGVRYKYIKKAEPRRTHVRTPRTVGPTHTFGFPRIVDDPPAGQQSSASDGDEASRRLRELEARRQEIYKKLQATLKEDKEDDDDCYDEDDESEVDDEEEVDDDNEEDKNDGDTDIVDELLINNNRDLRTLFRIRNADDDDDESDDEEYDEEEDDDDVDTDVVDEPIKHQMTIKELLEFYNVSDEDGEEENDEDDDSYEDEDDEEEEDENEEAEVIDLCKKIMELDLPDDEECEESDEFDGLSEEEWAFKMLEEQELKEKKDAAESNKASAASDEQVSWHLEHPLWESESEFNKALIEQEMLIITSDVSLNLQGALAKAEVCLGEARAAADEKMVQVYEKLVYNLKHMSPYQYAALKKWYFSL